MDEIIEIEVRIERELAYREGTGWGSYGCVPADYNECQRVKLNKYGNMSVNGIVHRLEIGSVYQMRAKVVEDKEWGTQYKIIKMHQEIPVTPEQVKHYVKNFVTPLQYEAIYAVYEGQNVIELMKNDQFDYEKISGFGLFTYEKVKHKLMNNLALQELINEFPELDYKILSKLMKDFTTATLLVEKLRENPYIMTKIDGVGFRTADKIALELGIEETSPFRIHAALHHVLKEVELNGDTYIKESRLISKSYEMLKVKKPIIKAELNKAEGLMKVDTKYCFENTFRQEAEVAAMLLNRKNNSIELNFDVEKFIEEQENRYEIKLTEQQKLFFKNFKNHNVTLLIGYAGCGKSFLQKLLINLIEKVLGLSYILMAPTGKASKVLSQYTDRPAWTIHKATGIGKDEQEFMDIQIWQDIIIIDESSMCGVGLANLMLKKIANPDARIIFIGDSFQIPSVDKGNLLFDMQESKVFPTTMLDVVFRQGEGGILDIVTMVRLGKKFIPDNLKGVRKFGDNCILVACPQAKMVDGYKHYYKEFLPKYGMLGIMVLSPTKKGKLGTYAINKCIQEIVNPQRHELDPEIIQIHDKEEMIFRINDYVLNTVNSYKMKTIQGSEVDIMNGETGLIVDLDVKEKSLTIDFDGIQVVFKSDNIHKLIHAHAITKHKSQGSACDSVLSITDKAHTHQLNANLIYTAWTRARDYLAILCQPEVLNRALEQFENLRRNTFLYEILVGEISVEKRILTGVQ